MMSTEAEPPPLPHFSKWGGSGSLPGGTTCHQGEFHLPPWQGSLQNRSVPASRQQRCCGRLPVAIRVKQTKISSSPPGRQSHFPAQDSRRASGQCPQQIRQFQLMILYQLQTQGQHAFDARQPGLGRGQRGGLLGRGIMGG